MKAKTVVVCALTGVLALAPLTGCAGSQIASESASDQATEQTDEQSTEETEAVVGGWAMNEKPAVVLSTEEQEIFAKASAGYTGVELEPVTVLATQLVSGTNYAYLCIATTETANPTTYWVLAVVYNNLEGNATVTSVKDIDLANTKVTENVQDTSKLVGAWEVAIPSNAIVLPEDVNQAFAEAAENYADVTLSPMALLGTQVVAGTNYKILCQGTANTEDSQAALYVVDLYVDLKGNAELTSVQVFDLLAYV